MENLDDMRIFAAVAEAGTLSSAAEAIGISKQTVSRRLTELEEALGVQLLHRSTRGVRLTEIGEAFAERCIEVVRLAEEATHAVADRGQTPAGTLRVSADPVFGEAFLTGILVEYAQTWPEVDLEVVLTRRRVDLVEERFDVAFRVGPVDGPGLTSTRLGPARICYCASPDYVARNGAPTSPERLRHHDCIVVVHPGRPTRWPFRDGDGVRLQEVRGRFELTSFAMAHEAARAGLGVALFPAFACARDIREGRLVTVLDEHAVEVGGIHLVTPTHKYLAARTRAFVDLAGEYLEDVQWSV